ncbi:hypothetical protein, partial [Spongiibacter sp.]
YRQGEAANGVVLRIWRGKTTIFYECGKLCRASLIKGYGAKNGMVVDSNSKLIMKYREDLERSGYGYSCFNIQGSCGLAQEFIDEVLIGDWGAIT